MRTPDHSAGRLKWPGPWCAMVAGLFAFAVLQGPSLAQSVDGVIVPKRELHVGVGVQGILKEVFVEEGDAVKKGDRLARLDDQLEALAVERAAKVIEKAEFESNASQRLLERQMTSREDALQKMIALELARIEARAAQAKLEQRTILAPLDGIVVKRHKHPGEATLENDVVVDIVHVQTVLAQFYVDLGQAMLLRTGSKMSFRVNVAGVPKVCESTVVFVDPRVDAPSGLVRIQLEIDNRDGALKAGMRVAADFSAKASDGANNPKPPE